MTGGWPPRVGRILARHQVPHLSAIDPVTGEAVRSSRRTPTATNTAPRARWPTLMSKSSAGYLKAADGVCTAAMQRCRSPTATRKSRSATTTCTPLSMTTARLAYSEIVPDEKDLTCAAFLHRAMAWFAGHGIRVRRLLTDNAMVYRDGTNWGWACTAWGLKRRFIKPGCPWTNGKVECFNRTLLNDWAYARPWSSNSLRTRGLDRFLHRYNTQRGHSALRGHPPMSRLGA